MPPPASVRRRKRRTDHISTLGRSIAGMEKATSKGEIISSESGWSLRRSSPLTEGDFDNTHGACSPDGRWLAFTSDRAEDRDANMATDIYLLNLEDDSLRRLTGGKQAIGQPVWSRDSQYIAAIGNPIVAEHAAYNTALLVAPVQGGEVSNLLAGQDISATNGLYGDVPGPEADHGPIWSDDGSRDMLCESAARRKRHSCATLSGEAPPDR